MKVLVTGGVGYIGSHACVAIAGAGHVPVIVDNLVNSKVAVLERIRALAGGAEIGFHRADIRDREALASILATERVDAVMHFAGLKAVNESVEQPLRYYDNNVSGTVALMEAMKQHGVRLMVFSSSAAVYGEPASVPIFEAQPRQPTNAYGWTKAFIEQILEDEARADSAFRFCALRYFNPVGAHPSGQIGEDPRGTPSNLFPYIMQVAGGRQPALRVFGNDYPTPDGTGVRDYIHVLDLVQGHLDALRYLEGGGHSVTLNLGTGRGYSVLEAVKAFESASGKPVPLQIRGRRPGDVAACFANPALAGKILGWQATRDLAEMCRDLWRWHTANPSGYPD